MIPREDNEDHRPSYRATYTMTVTITRTVTTDGTEKDSENVQDHYDEEVNDVLAKLERMGYGVDSESEIRPV